MRLNDLYLPVYQYSETHCLDIDADPAQVMAAALSYRPEDDRFFRCAIQLRELPMRLMGRLRDAASEKPAAFGMENFTLLQVDDDKAATYGLAGKLWLADFGQVPIVDASAFEAFDVAGSVKLVVGFTCERMESGLTRLTTQTRVHCLDAEARRRFRPYWYLIRPVSGIIRRRMLNAIARQCRM